MNYPHYGTLLSNENEVNINIYENVDATQTYERRQTRKTMYFMSPLIQNSRRGKAVVTGSDCGQGSGEGISCEVV